MNKKAADTARLTTSAVLIALSTVLSLIKVYEMPWGGAITLASMLPIILISYLYGTKTGIFSAFLYSLIQAFLGSHVISAAFLPGDSRMIWYKALLMVLCDYILAYTLLGVGGVFRKKDKPLRSVMLASVVGGLLRYLMHFLSGMILWGSYAEGFFEDLSGKSLGGFADSVLSHYSGVSLAAVYSLFYNGCYMIPEIIITVILGCVTVKGVLPHIRISSH